MMIMQVWMSDMKEEVESQYSMDTLKERTPLSKTGPFVYDNVQYEVDANDNVPASTSAEDAAEARVY
jgi:hypothetical protein